MYCKKLKTILEEENNDEFTLLINKLDGFIRNQTTTRERRRINPLKFSIERRIEPGVAYRLFQSLTVKGLFKAHAYYSCECGDQIYIDKTLKDEYECDCEDKTIIPYFDKNRIYIYFELLEKVEVCTEEFMHGDTDRNTDETEIPLDLLDHFEDYKSGKTEASLAEIEKVTGEENYYENTVMSQRADDRREYMRLKRNESS